MKKLYHTIGALLLVSIVTTAVIIVLSPPVIPAHYNAAGQVDRFGSRYEQLIFPALALLMTGFLLAVQKYQQKKNAPASEQKIILYTAVFCLVLFWALGLIFGAAAINYNKTTSFEPDAAVQLAAVVTGAMLVALGNLMPKARRNAFFGLRTGWSMANDETWRRSQRFGGISAVVCGLAMIALSALLPPAWTVPVLTVLLLGWALAATAASYIYFKQSQ